MHMLNLSVKMREGRTYYGSSAKEVLVQMMNDSWDFPSTILEYKEGVAYRAEVCGMKLLFWDMTSFLFAMQEAGVCEITIGGDEVEKKK